MPELPDVAGFKQHIDRHALGRVIDQCEITDKRVIKQTSARQLQRTVNGAAIESTTRHGKYLLGKLSNGQWIAMHFGMTGEPVYIKKPDDPPKYTRLLFQFESNGALSYTSRRMLGYVMFINDHEQFAAEHELGIDALDDALTRDRFFERFAGRRGNLKAALMNQSIVSGIGNEYSDEILFQARLHPETKVNDLDEQTMKQLYQITRRVLRVAARHGGNKDELPRQYFLRTRDEAHRCPVCNRSLQKETVSGRSSYYCPHCQSKS